MRDVTSKQEHDTVALPCPGGRIMAKEGIVGNLIAVACGVLAWNCDLRVAEAQPQRSLRAKFIVTTSSLVPPWNELDLRIDKSTPLRESAFTNAEVYWDDKGSFVLLATKTNGNRDLEFQLFAKTTPTTNGQFTLNITQTILQKPRVGETKKAGEISCTLSKQKALKFIRGKELGDSTFIVSFSGVCSRGPFFNTGGAGGSGTFTSPVEFSFTGFEDPSAKLVDGYRKETGALMAQVADLKSSLTRRTEERDLARSSLEKLSKEISANTVPYLKGVVATLKDVNNYYIKLRREAKEVLASLENASR